MKQYCCCRYCPDKNTDQGTWSRRINANGSKRTKALRARSTKGRMNDSQETYKMQ